MLKKLLVTLVILLALVVGAYFVVTSGAFVRGVVIPKVGEAMHATLTVEDASLSPFSSLSLRGVKLVTEGPTPLATVAGVEARFSLMDILGGKMTVQELTVDSPVVQIVPTSNGKDTLSPILSAASGPSPSQPSATPASSKPIQFAIGKVSIKNGTIRYLSSPSVAGEPQQNIEISGLQFNLDQWVTGQSGKLAVVADLKSSQGGSGAMQGKLQAQFDLALDERSSLRSVKGMARASVDQATGSLASLAGFSPVLDTEITPAEVRLLSFRFEQNGKLLGGITAAGPFDLAKQEGKLGVQVDGIDRQVLNPLGAAAGLDFGATRISGAADLEFAKKATSIRAQGKVGVAKFSLATNGKTTPELTLNASFDATADTTAKVLQLALLNLQGLQRDEPWLQGALSAPMSVAWGTGSAAAGDAAFQLSLSEVALSDWKAFTGDSLTSGKLGLKAALLSSNGGKTLKLDTDLQIRDLGIQMNPQPFTQGALQLKLQAQVVEFSRLSLDAFKLTLTRAGQPALGAQGSAGFDPKEGAFNLKTSLEMVGQRLFGTGATQPVQLALATEGTFKPAGILELKKLQVSLPPTTRATPNEANLSGRWDGSNATDRKGSFVLQSPGLDLTSLYETFVNPNAPPPPTPPPTETAFPKTEPAAHVFPIRSFTLDTKLAKVFLGEIAMTDVQGLLLVEGGKVHLVPFQLVLNGAPVRAGVDLDLGVVGTSYDLSWQIGGVPIDPIVNTLNPAMRGQAQGRLVSSAQIKGSGITGVNLKKNLSAQTQLSLTNANLRVVPDGHKVWILPIDIHLIATLLNVPELTKSPITQVDLRASASGGQVKLEEGKVKGDAFLAEAKGAVQLEDQLERSGVRIPIDLSLSRQLAGRANLLSSDTPTNAPYAKLPPFVTLVGTLAKVDTQVDKLQVAKITARAAVGLLGSGATNVVGTVEGAVGSLGNALGNLLGADRGKTNATGTNQVANTNKPPSLNPLNLFKKKQP